MSNRMEVVSGALSLLCASTLWAQPRPLSPNVARYVSVNAPVVALTHARVVDGTGAAAREDQTIVIQGDRINAVGSAGTVKVPAGAQVVDLTGSTVIPGLVGLHEHTWFGGMAVSTPMSVTAPLLYLGMGVTTAMTAGTMFAYQELNLQRAGARSPDISAPSRSRRRRRSGSISCSTASSRTATTCPARSRTCARRRIC